MREREELFSYLVPVHEGKVIGEGPGGREALPPVLGEGDTPTVAHLGRSYGQKRLPRFLLHWWRSEPVHRRPEQAILFAYRPRLEAVRTTAEYVLLHSRGHCS